MKHAPATLTEANSRAGDQTNLDLAVSFDNTPIGMSLTDLEGN